MSDSFVSIGVGSCHRDSDKAIFVSLSGKMDLFWIPKSAIGDDSEVWKPGQKGDIVVAEWWAEENQSKI